MSRPEWHKCSMRTDKAAEVLSMKVMDLFSDDTGQKYRNKSKNNERL